MYQRGRSAEKLYEVALPGMGEGLIDGDVNSDAALNEVGLGKTGGQREPRQMELQSGERGVCCHGNTQGGGEGDEPTTTAAHGRALGGVVAVIVRRKRAGCGGEGVPLASGRDRDEHPPHPPKAGAAGFQDIRKEGIDGMGDEGHSE